MAYPFPVINREVFQKTFLKDVHIIYHFPKVDLESVCAKKLLDFYHEKFNLQNVEEEQLSSGILVRSENELIRLEFSLEQVLVKMKFPAYKSFSFAEQWIPIMQQYLSILGVEKVEKAILWKYNELQYTLPNEDTEVTSAMKQVFSPELLSFGTDESSFEEISKEFKSLSRWEKRIIFDDNSNSQSKLTIEYGFCEFPNKKAEGRLTMKTYIESVGTALEVSSLLDYSKQMNDYLDYAFQWCISKEIINKMRTV